MIKRYTLTTIGNPKTFETRYEIEENKHGQFVKYEDVKQYLPKEKTVKEKWEEWREDLMIEFRNGPINEYIIKNGIELANAAIKEAERGNR